MRIPLSDYRAINKINRIAAGRGRAVEAAPVAPERPKNHPDERAPGKKLTHKAVKFENISRHEGQHCSICRHFIAANPPRCEAVKPPIPPAAWCERYEPKDAA